MKPLTPVAVVTLVALLVGAPDARTVRVRIVTPPGPLGAGQALVIAPVATASATVVIAGRVRAPDGTPVAGALVALARPADPAPGDEAPGADNRPQLEIVARSDATGRFRLVVAPGPHQGSASAPGFAPARAEVSAPAGSAPAGDDNAWLDLRLGAEAGASEIAGQVQDAAGQPVAGALLRATGSGIGAVVGFTAGDGIFHLGCEPGHHVIEASAPGFAPQRRDIELQGPKTVAFRLFAAARISGVVTRAMPGQAPAPVAGALVHAAAADLEARPRQVWADAAGRFAFTDLEPGRYVVWARESDRIGFHRSPVTVALAEAAIDVGVPLLPAATITGRVLDAHGAPLAAARLDLFGSGKTDLGFGSGRVTAHSDRDGRFVLAGLVAGRYRLRALVPGRPPVDLHDLVLLDRDVRDLDVRLPAGPGPAARPHETAARTAFIRGHVRWHDGDPAAGARVHCFASAHPGRAPGPIGSPVAVVAADGTYHLGPLSAGAQRCQAEYPDQPLATMIGIVNVGGWGRARPARIAIDLAPGQQRADLDLVLLRSDQTIAGIVRGPDGRAVAGALVWATQGFGSSGNGADSGRPRVASDQQGRFAITGLPGGEYELRALHPRFPLARKPGVIAGSETVEIALQAPAWISGRVLDLGGAPVAPVRIAVVEALTAGAPGRDVAGDPSGLRWVFQAGDGKDAGTFTVGPLAPGEYHLLASGATGTGLVSGLALAPSQWRQDVVITVGLGPTARADEGADSRR